MATSPRKLTWNRKMMVVSRNLLFQGFIFRFHVSFGGVNGVNKNLLLGLIYSTCNSRRGPQVCGIRELH